MSAEAERVTHMRKKALARGPRQTRDTYGPFAGDPQRLTLCGAEATLNDIGWADVRVAHSPAFKFVTCLSCRKIRFPEAVNS